MLGNLFSRIMLVFEAEDFRRAGYTLKEFCIGLSLTAADGFKLGFSVQDLLFAGFLDVDVAQAGYGLKELLANKISLKILHESGTILTIIR